MDADGLPSISSRSWVSGSVLRLGEGMENGTEMGLIIATVDGAFRYLAGVAFHLE